MTSKRENILDQLKTTLAGTAGGVGSRIYRERLTPITRAESPAIVLEPVSDDPSINVSHPKCDWNFRINIAVIVRGSSTTTPYEVADPICESLHAKVLADLTVGGYAIDIQPSGVTFEMIDSDQPAAVINNSFIIQYRTNIGSLTT
tara:strand:- start:410 stop:847 length:438 start_codon:yes stop_codon:yes gene_type:complete